MDGFLFARLIGPLSASAPRVAAWFTLIGMVLGVYSIERRRTYGRFPMGITYLIFGIPFFCTFVGIIYKVVEWVQQWLGIT